MFLLKLLIAFTQKFSLCVFPCISKFLSNGIHVLLPLHPLIKHLKMCLCFDIVGSQVFSPMLMPMRTAAVGAAQPTPTNSLQPQLLWSTTRWKFQLALPNMLGSKCASPTVLSWGEVMGVNASQLKLGFLKTHGLQKMSGTFLQWP